MSFAGTAWVPGGITGRVAAIAIKKCAGNLYSNFLCHISPIWFYIAVLDLYSLC